jgi:hypothetical protein
MAKRRGGQNQAVPPRVAFGHALEGSLMVRTDQPMLDQPTLDQEAFVLEVAGVEPGPRGER